MRSTVKFAALAFSLLAFGGTAEAAGCAAVIKGVAASAAGLKVEFIRPVVVSRGQGDGTDVLDIVTEPKIDGQLRCRGDKFVSFTARIPASGGSELRDAFFRLQQAAMACSQSLAHAARHDGRGCGLSAGVHRARRRGSRRQGRRACRKRRRHRPFLDQVGTRIHPRRSRVNGALARLGRHRGGVS